MANELIQGQPQRGAGMEQGAAPQGFEAPQPGSQAHPSSGVWAPAGGAMPAAPTMAAEGQPAAVRPQGASGGCGCGGAQVPEGMGPSQQEVIPAQHEGAPGQQPSAPAYQGGIPTQAPYGMQPALTPAQRTAMLAGYPGSAGGLQMAVPVGRGVAPSQQTIASCPCPLPNDFIWSENSQLVYVVGTLGYDFITDARRDYFVQQFADLSRNHPYVSLFTQTLGLKPGPTYYPEDHRFMSAYLNQGLYVSIPPEFQREAIDRATDVGSLVWVLFQENQPLYALRPLQTFANIVLQHFANFLFNQSRHEWLLGPDGEPLVPKKANPNKADRVSIAGRIIGDITLYNGQRVPVLDVSTRALFQWTVDLLIKDVAEAHPEVLDAESDLYKALKNLLDRIYYEVRNLGQAPSDRAINFMATNIFEAADVIVDAIKNGKALDSIYAEKSPLCRPKSLCFDVVMRFFDPKNRLEKALDEYRMTMDLCDLAPIQIGTTRKWARFA